MIPVLYSAYYEYTAEDLERCVALSLGDAETTDDDLQRYDFNGDGIISNVDVVTCRNIINQGVSFDTYGVGALNDAISCVVKAELNGQYELTMQYPVFGEYFNDLVLRAIIKAKPDKVSREQPFRIYRITKPISGVVTVYARHIAYDLAGVPVSPFTASTLQTALIGLKENVAVPCPFSFESDMTSATGFSVEVPSNIWPLMGADEGGLLATYGGEYEFDRYTVHLWGRRGADRGVSIRYGKNMTNAEQDANIANCWTGVYPYWIRTKDEETTIVTLPEKIVSAEGNFGYTKILALDLTSEFDEAPTQEQLREAAEKYMTDNDIGTPEISWKVEFVSLEQSDEFAGQALFESVYLGDDVAVEFEKLGISAKARAVKIQYNVLLDRYDSVELGSVKSTLADTIVSQNKEIEKKPTTTMIQQIAATLTAALMGVDGGAVRMLDTNGDGSPDTLYIADDPDPAQALKVWRFNYEGWAASKNGYNGPFVMGATLDEGLLANFVTAANLTAGTIRSSDGKTFLLELANGTISTAVDHVFYAADYTNTDLDRINLIAARQAEATAADLEKYDFYRDGVISAVDAVLCRNMIALGEDLTVTWHFELTPNNADSLMKIWRDSSASATAEVLFEIGAVGVKIFRFPKEDMNPGMTKHLIMNTATGEVSTAPSDLIPKYIGDTIHGIGLDDVGAMLSFSYAIRNEEISVQLSQAVSQMLPIGAEIAIVRSWGAAVTIETSGIRLGLPGYLTTGVGGLTPTTAQSFTIAKPFGTVILKKIENNNDGDIWIVQGDVEYAGGDSDTLTITGGEDIPIELKEGEILQITYLTSVLTAGNVTLEVNGAAPDGGYYSPLTENNVYAGGIITYAGTNTYASAQFCMQIVRDRLLVWGTGIRGNGSGIGTFNAFWKTTAPTSFAISHAGTVVYKKV